MSRQIDTPDELLSIIPSASVADVAALARTMYPIWLPLTKKPFELNPTFEGSPDVGGADADMIIDGTLVEIKTSSKPGLDKLTLYQLIGYLLLDYRGEHHIRDLGIYYARLGRLIRVSLTEVITAVAADPATSLEHHRAALWALLHPAGTDRA